MLQPPALAAPRLPPGWRNRRRLRIREERVEGPVSRHNPFAVAWAEPRP